MKEKTIKVIKEEEFRIDLIDYVINYSRRIKVDINNSNLKVKFKKRKKIYEIKQSIVNEENSKLNVNSNENSNNESSISSYSSLSSSSSNHSN